MSNELFKGEKYLQCCNIPGLFNVLKIINDIIFWIILPPI